ncbi:hypothetical protein GpartN1_g7344.t1 [Galdieria partita]|uniref:Uncharacterized protein n=1 Tax=Galdieria partita TaxID=83374 RepID=A0A9C7Q315_9RHOD|nr:hypothetical protein GpartN1_g7344.t1 [Galdieria partita]
MPRWVAWIGGGENVWKPLCPLGNSQRSKLSRHFVGFCSHRCCFPLNSGLVIGRRKKFNCSALSGDLSLPRVKNPKEEHSWIQSSIRRWLDEEWQPQSVHQKIGEEAATRYLKLRERGEDHLGSLVLELSLELENVDFKDAFVDSFTVANKVAELLMEKLLESGNKDSATGSISLQRPTIPTQEDVQLVVRAMSSGFERYQFLSKILDETIPDSTVHAAVLVCLGYQLDTERGEWQPKTVDKETRRSLEELCSNFDFLQNELGLSFLEQQLPRNEDTRKDLEDFINQLAGDFYAEHCRKVGYQVFLRRAIVVKWLYSIGQWMS